MQPRRPQGQRAPSFLTTMWPISPASPRPSQGLPSRTSPPPTPVPQNTPTTRLVGTAGAEAELALGRDLHVVADPNRRPEALAEPRPELELILPAGQVSRLGDGSGASVHDPRGADPDSGQRARLDPRRLRRLPHRLGHLLGDVLGASRRRRRPARLAEHLPPAVDDHGLDLGATEVDAAAGDHAAHATARASAYPGMTREDAERECPARRTRRATTPGREAEGAGP